MLFNSAGFLFLFLPLTLLGFLILKWLGSGKTALGLIGFSSLIFYSIWDYHYLGLLIGSILFNYIVGHKISQSAQFKKHWLWFGLGGNLVCLGWFKYAGFLVVNLNTSLQIDITVPNVILPLGISFVTFVQIAYLVDAWRGKVATHTFSEYLAFVTFFPHLIAGPILNHKTIMPQFHVMPSAAYDWSKAAMGLSLLAIGLFKKVVIADELSKYATPVFTAAGNGEIITLMQAWEGVLAYTLQLYFDFSAYSDMAIGIGLMFGIRLPENFLSPYKATSIIDFWRRWHITLSNFLRDYLYIPLGGNRKGEFRRYRNLLITMLLGGLWHGAGWTFVVWGGLHGLYLTINHLWRRIIPLTDQPSKVRSILGWFITLLAVIVAWVFFRSANLDAAFSVIHSMVGLNGTGEITKKAWKLIAIGFAITLFAPNPMQMIAHAEGHANQKWYSWTLNKRWSLLTIVLLSVSLYLIVYQANRISEFIYFQF